MGYVYALERWRKCAEDDAGDAAFYVYILSECYGDQICSLVISMRVKYQHYTLLLHLYHTGSHFWV